MVEGGRRSKWKHFWCETNDAHFHKMFKTILFHFVRQLISLCGFLWCLYIGRDLHLDILMFFCSWLVRRLRCLFLCGVEVSGYCLSVQSKNIFHSVCTIVLKFLTAWDRHTFQMMAVIVSFCFCRCLGLSYMSWGDGYHVEDVISAWHDKPLFDDLFIYSCLFLPYHALPGIH